ncbi:MAG: DUF4406 domain-containing protein [Bacteroidales bacterium]|nr:DUF4406 domain-containing protein [Bacteroidales bacterium]
MDIKKVYISGKITGLLEPEAKQIFANAYNMLEGFGYQPVNPFDVAPFTHGWAYENYLVKGIEGLLQCQAIYMLHNWGNSKGARIEYAIARELGLKIWFEEDLEIISE